MLIFIIFFYFIDQHPTCLILLTPFIQMGKTCCLVIRKAVLLFVSFFLLFRSHAGGGRVEVDVWIGKVFPAVFCKLKIFILFYYFVFRKTVGNIFNAVQLPVENVL